MKIFITHVKPRNFILITEVLLLAPFSYATNQNIPPEIGESTRIVFAPTVENKHDAELAFSSATTSKNKKSETDVKFIPIEKVRRGIVQTIDDKNNSLILKVGDILLPVKSTATTTFYFGEGEKATSGDVTNNMKIYVFGNIKSDNSSMYASKIVISNRSKLLRR